MSLCLRRRPSSRRSSSVLCGSCVQQVMHSHCEVVGAHASTLSRRVG